MTIATVRTSESSGDNDRAVHDELEEILSIASRIASTDGTTQSLIPFLSVIRSSKPTAITHGVLTPSFCMIVQGRKVIHIGAQIIRYGAGNYLASLIDMPWAGQILSATRIAPYLAVRMDFTSDEVASVILDAKLTIRAGDGTAPGAFVGESDPKLLAALSRMLRALENPQDAAFLAPSLKRETIYRLLTGRWGAQFCQKFILERHTLGIGKAIAWLKENFDRSVRVEQLAKLSDMSTSSLHHKFKALTTLGPLQYQKQLRLQEARRLLLSGTRDSTTAAREVGYESPSQFSREYRRLFGLPPIQDARTMRSRPQLER